MFFFFYFFIFVFNSRDSLVFLEVHDYRFVICTKRLIIPIATDRWQTAVLVHYLRPELHHLVHVIQGAVRMPWSEILMVGAHAHRGVASHLIAAAHVVPHLHLGLSALLIEVFHLVVVRWIVVLAVVMVRRRVVPVCVPVERIVGLVLVR